MATPEDSLRKAVLDDPDSDEPRKVYADWLVERDDPRGEFIHLQCDLPCLSATDELWWLKSQQAELLLQDHTPGWVRRLPKHGKAAWGIEPAFGVRRDWFDRGLVERATFAGLADFERHFEAMWNTTPVRHIRLNRWADKAIPVISQPQIMDRLKGIWLTWDGFDAACTRVPPFFQQMPLAGIERLRLFDRMLLPDGMEALLSTPLDSLRRLEIAAYTPTHDYLPNLASWPGLAQLNRLEYAAYGAANEGVIAFSKSPHLNNLKELVLSDNHIDAIGVAALCESVLPDQLGELHLSGNPFGEDGVTAIANTPRPWRLRRLDLDSVDVGREGAEALAGSTKLPNLHYLNLHGAKLNDDAAMAIAQSSGLVELRGLNLQGNTISHESILAIADSTSLPNLAFLQFTPQAVNAATAKKLRERFPKMRKTQGEVSFSRL